MYNIRLLTLLFLAASVRVSAQDKSATHEAKTPQSSRPQISSQQPASDKEGSSQLPKSTGAPTPVELELDSECLANSLNHNAGAKP